MVTLYHIPHDTRNLLVLLSIFSLLIHIFLCFESLCQCSYIETLCNPSCVLRYLCETMTRSQLLPLDNPLTLRAYLDASWADDHDTHRSTNGFWIFLGFSLIS